MDPELKSLLQSIDQGDNERIPKLVDWLQSQRDPRAELARNAAVLDPQEIADELVKIRSMRRSRNSLFSAIAELVLVCISPLFGMIWTESLHTDHLEATPKTPRWWPPSPRKCLKDVEKALSANVIPTDVVRAMTYARRRKIEILLKAFQYTEQPTPVSLPGSN